MVKFGTFPKVQRCKGKELNENVHQFVLNQLLLPIQLDDFKYRISINNFKFEEKKIGFLADGHVGGSEVWTDGTVGTRFFFTTLQLRAN